MRLIFQAVRVHVCSSGKCHSIPPLIAACCASASTPLYNGLFLLCTRFFSELSKFRCRSHTYRCRGALPRTHLQRPDRRRLLYKTHREAIKSSTKETNTIFFFSFFRRAYSVLLPCLQHVTSLHWFPLVPLGHNFDTQRR
uniref:(northern house mosquito) hypothetical protein n=1 Tax=Culex pipiens TaxID=7175 RepID=A0A8D8C7H5_CULPI